MRLFLIFIDSSIVKQEVFTLVIVLAILVNCCVPLSLVTKKSVALFTISLFCFSRSFLEKLLDEKSRLVVSILVSSIVSKGCRYRLGVGFTFPLVSTFSELVFVAVSGSVIFTFPFVSRVSGAFLFFCTWIKTHLFLKKKSIPFDFIFNFAF